MENILLYGGRFDPIHNGHLLAARQIKEKLGFSRVIFIPCADPAHKKVVASFGQRVFMLRRAIQLESDFEYSTCEGQRAGKSYTIDTVREFQNANTKIHWLIGDDNLESISSWHDYENLRKECTFVVARRHCTNAPKVIDPNFIFVETQNYPLSSTQIRGRLNDDLSVRYMVPDSVLDYINQHQLYVQKIKCENNTKNSSMIVEPSLPSTAGTML